MRHPPLPCIHPWPLEPTAQCPQVPEAFSGPAKGPQDAWSSGKLGGIVSPRATLVASTVQPGSPPPRQGPGQAGLPAMAGVSWLAPGPVGLSALGAPSWHSGLGSSGHPVHSCAGPCPLPLSAALSGSGTSARPLPTLPVLLWGRVQPEASVSPGVSGTPLGPPRKRGLGFRNLEVPRAGGRGHRGEGNSTPGGLVSLGPACTHTCTHTCTHVHCTHAHTHRHMHTRALHTHAHTCTDTGAPHTELDFGVTGESRGL